MVFDNFENGSREALARVAQITQRSFEVIDGDVRDAKGLVDAFARHAPDAVIHFAGRKAVGESVAKPLSYYDVNVTGSLRLLEAMTEAGCHHIVFSSSATVYGTPHYLPYDENHPTHPVNPYGRTKRVFEDMLKDWCEADRARKAVSLRYFNPVGAHPSGKIGEDPKGIPNNIMPFIAQTAVGRRDALSIFGDDYDTRDGTGERDYIHVMDLAEAHLAALTNLDEANGHRALNIGTGRGLTVNELVAAFEAATGQTVPTRIVSRRPGDLPSFFANSARAKATLGWQARRPLDEMCRDTWTWQSANPAGYANF